MAKDVLTTEELAEFNGRDGVMVPGKPYLFIMSFGWGKIGYYVKHLSPLKIMVAHCNHFRNAGKDYGRLATEGAGEQCEWRYEGEVVELNTAHIIEVAPYEGVVNRNPAASA